ncbi:hypothetical protein JTB14_024686 [Gonioctena quinquepunctata]|nr:hypothetical protein JTB14_024686 [Gonioctena quinquepunctata]
MIFGVLVEALDYGHFARMNEVKRLVEMWSHQIGAKLTELSEKMTKQNEFRESFRCLETKLAKEDATLLVQETAFAIRSMMDSKAQAVRNIADYAEFLSYHRSNKPVFANSTYYFYNADNLTNTENDEEGQAELSREILNVI